MPKRGMFRRDRNYCSVDHELATRAFAGLYALHGHLFKKERAAKALKVAKGKK